MVGLKSAGDGGLPGLAIDTAFSPCPAIAAMESSADLHLGERYGNEKIH